MLWTSCGSPGRGVAVAREFSYDEVQRLERIAWHHRGYLYTEGKLLRVACLAAPSDVRHLQQVRLSTMKGDEEWLAGGWRHLEDCDCEACRG